MQPLVITIIKIILFITVFTSSICFAQNNADSKLDESTLEKELEKIENSGTFQDLDIEKEIESLKKIEKQIEDAAKKKKQESTTSKEVKKKEATGKASPMETKAEDFSGDDYEEFLKKLKKPSPKKEPPTQKKAQIEKIDVVLEINKYFTEEKLVPVDLQDCIKVALKNNFEIRIFDTREIQSKWSYRNTFKNYVPNLQHQFEINRLNGDFIVGGVVPLYVNESPYFALFRFDWTLFKGGANIYTTKAARSRYKASIKNAEFTKEKVLRDTAVSYYSLLGVKLGIEILTRNLNETKEQLRVNKQNFEAGIGTKFDILRAKAEVAQAEQRLLNSYNQFRLEQANLANILGISVFAPLLPVENDVKEQMLIDENDNAYSISKIAQKARPDLKSLLYEIKALRNDKKIIRSGFLPEIKTFWQLGYVGTTEDGMGPSNSFGINVTMPFGTNLGVEEFTSFRRIDAKIEESLLNLQNKYRSIEENIINFFYDSKTAKERIAAAKEEVVAADESLRLAFLRLEAGLGIYVDVLQSQTAKTDAKINLIRAIIDYNVAQTRLLFESGTISTSNILKDYDSYLSKKYIQNPNQAEAEGEITLPK